MREVISKHHNVPVKIEKGEKHLRIIINHDDKSNYPELKIPKKALKVHDKYEYVKMKDIERSQ